jgi:hypothetical protein
MAEYWLVVYPKDLLVCYRGPLGPPMFKIDPVGNVEISHPQWCSVGGRAERTLDSRGHQWAERLHGRQGDKGTETSQEAAAVCSGKLDSLDWGNWFALLTRIANQICRQSSIFWKNSEGSSRQDRINPALSTAHLAAGTSCSKNPWRPASFGNR